jgi:hypothetical protein
MGKGIGLIVGGALTALGLLGIIAWWSSVLVIIKAGLALAAFLIGLGAIIFGLGELRAPAETPPPPPPAEKSPELTSTSTDKSDTQEES